MFLESINYYYKFFVRMNVITQYLRKFFIIVFPLLVTSSSLAQADKFRFEHISTSGGLSSNSITDILQDSYGFIWFATDLGLHRWDGYQIKTYYHDPNDNNSLSASEISTIYEDSKGVLWVGTFNRGLNSFNRQLENFTRYDISNINSGTTGQSSITKIYEDLNHNLWIGTSHGLVKFERDFGRFKKLIIDSTSHNEEYNRAINFINALCEKDANTLLVGTKCGLVQFDLVNGIFKKSQFNELELNKSSNKDLKDIRSIYKELSGVFWVATVGGGLCRYEPFKKRVRHFLQKSDDAGTLRYIGINSITTDNSGDLWIGTWNGLYNYDKLGNKFRVHLHNSRDINSINGSDISKVYLDRDRNLWIGTRSNGVNLLPKWQKPFMSYEWDSEDPNSLGFGVVKSICEDNKGNLWIGSWGGGVSYYNFKNDKFTHYTTVATVQNRILSNYINIINVDKEDNIWIGATGLYWLDSKNRSIHTFDEIKRRRVRTICNAMNGNLWIGFKYSGFALYSKANKSFRYFYHDSNDILSLSDNRITCMSEDKSGRLWIGTVDGLNCLERPLSKHVMFIKYYHDSRDPTSILHNTVTDIYQDCKGRLWIGTALGLNLYDAKTKSFKPIEIIKGSLNNVIQKILEDDKENLWIRCGGKLVRYNPDTGDIRSYDKRDKFISIVQPGRWDEVLYIGKTGRMYYGSVNKFVTFWPDRLIDNPNPPRVYITNILLHNRPLEIGKDSPLKNSITQVRKIELRHNDNALSFEFAALDYTNPRKNEYAYMMEGLDDNWIYTDASRRFANYTNLDPGEYLFRVKASNSDGIWNSVGVSVKVIILPPWWAAWWSYTAYVCFFLGLLYFMRRYELNRQKFKHSWELKRVEAENYQEIDRIKSRFFTNISHEFRTPLTLIKVPIQKILSGDFKGNIKKECQMILRNTNRLMQLINQLLDLSKLDSGQMGLRASPEDIVPLLKGLTHSFESLAKQKNIKLLFKSPESKVIVYVDRDKIEKIIINLLSNAFKFTPEWGNVIVNINVPAFKSLDKTQLKKKSSLTFTEIQVTNTGPGILPEHLRNIFNRFYQFDDSSVQKYEGTGIGLALAKELVELHHGKIKVESKPEKETTFTVYLPLGKDHLQPEEIIETNTEIGTGIDREIMESLLTFESQTDSASNRRVKHTFTILIVEDNPDMRNYISENLKPGYKIVEAKNGEEGIQKALRHSPNLIISDVMMPKMDGFRFCTEIKKDERTSHIPIILLTAKASSESKIKGFETGADDYLTKPFDNKELQVRIKNLINQRRKLQEKFQKEIKVSPSDITVTSIDEQLVQRAIYVVERNISDPNFDTAGMSKDLGISRMLLNTKLKALTGLSTGEFIRTLRLKRAAQLFQQGYGNVTQVAYEVGFQSLSYFAKAFREHFGKSPSQYFSNGTKNSNRS